jgi:predicted dithiol-disulfide oxidoreductase (DUF899 family)
MSELRYPNESAEYRKAREALLKDEQELIRSEGGGYARLSSRSWEVPCMTGRKPDEEAMRKRPAIETRS